MSDVHAGMPPPEWEDWERRLVHFHRFSSMSTVRGRAVTSPSFRIYEHEWRVRMYPGGQEDSSSSRDCTLALFLDHISGAEISVKWGIVIRDRSGAVFRAHSTPPADYNTFSEAKTGTDKGWGYINFVKRAHLVDPSNEVLDRGTLTIEVRMRPDNDDCCSNFIPRNTVARDILESFADENTSDVIFLVKDERSQESVPFHAHRFVMQFCARGSVLASLCEDLEPGGQGGGTEAVLISGVNPEVFVHMLRHVYGGTVPTSEWKARSREYIDAADRYGVRNLKIEAEAWHVKLLELTAENVVEELLYADEKNCFLLKEAAVNFMLRNGKDVLTSESFERVPWSRGLIGEVMWLAATKGSGSHDGARGREDADREDILAELSINELRARLHDRGIADVDGPRRSLIDRLGPGTKKGSKESPQ